MAGLCNRLWATASAVYIAKQYKCPLQINWNKYEGLNAEFTDLFEPIQVKDVKLCSSKTWLYNINYTKDFLLRKPLLSLLYSQVIRKCNYHDGDNIFNMIKPNCNKLLLVSWSKLSEVYDYKALFVPTPPIQQLINHITQPFTPHTIGVHIRRTDNKMAIQGSPTQVFIDIINNELNNNPLATFYIASDDEQVKQEITSAFGNKIITAKGILTRNSAEGMQWAVAELFALSRTTKIIGSYYSSYSATAAAIGGIPLAYAMK